VAEADVEQERLRKSAGVDADLRSRVVVVVVAATAAAASEFGRMGFDPEPSVGESSGILSAQRSGDGGSLESESLRIPEEQGKHFR